jgi:hypothetical protein
VPRRGDSSGDQNRAAAALVGIERLGNLIWASLEEKGISRSGRTVFFGKEGGLKKRAPSDWFFFYD